MEEDARHTAQLKEEEPLEVGWGRVAKGSTFAIRFVFRDGSHAIGQYQHQVCSPEPRNTPELIRLVYASDGKDLGLHEFIITGKKLDVIADRITAARLETLREGGSRDGTVIERITVRAVEED